MAETQRPARVTDTSDALATATSGTDAGGALATDTVTDASGAPVTSVVLRTPPGWQVFDVAQLGDARAIRERICRGIDGHVGGGEAFAAAVAQLAADTGGLGVFFAAIGVPGERDGTDLTSLTLAAAKPPQKRGDGLGDPAGGESPSGAAAESPSGAAPGAVEGGAPVAESVVSLPAGQAIRIESADVLPIDDVPALPVFCVQYALPIPAGEWTLVITFTTIGPSSIARLRAQFSQIVSTLELV